MKHQMVMFREECQIFGTRCDSYSTRRSSQEGVTWEASDFGLTIRREQQIDATPVMPARVRVEVVRIPWENVRQYEIVEERDRDEDVTHASQAAAAAQSARHPPRRG